MTFSITIKIHAPDPADAVHEFRNFGEDVFRELRDTCAVDLREIDRATDMFKVRKVRDENLPSVTQYLWRELERYHFAQFASVETEQDAQGNGPGEGA